MKNYLPAIFTMIAIVCMNTLSFAQNSVVLNLELTNTSTSTDFMFMEVYIETSPAYMVGNEGPNPNNPVPLFVGGTTMTTSLTFDENTEDIELFLTQVCSDNMGTVETATIPPVTLSYNGELDPSGNVTIDYNMELSCGEGGEAYWDCPNLMGNVGDYCQNGWGTINENCECVEIQGCNDFEVSTILLSNDDGTGNGSVEAIVSGGTPPYSYAWEAWSWDVIGTNAILENCEAGTYFVQVTDDNGCVVFGNVEVLLDTDVNTEECVAEFNIGQAFSENEIIPFELFVYVFGYDEANEYFWSFGDEGTSTDPFPTWTYETNGPYQLCLTVSNEENDCSETYCETIEVDSLGWIFGIQDGFTITIMNGDLDSVNDITNLSHHSIINMYPNPVNNNLTVNMNEIGDFEFIVTSLTGQTLLKTSITNSKVHRFDVSKLCSGMYILNITSGDVTESRTFVINR